MFPGSPNIWTQIVQFPQKCLAFGTHDPDETGDEHSAIATINHKRLYMSL